MSDIINTCGAAVFIALLILLVNWLAYTPEDQKHLMCAPEHGCIVTDKPHTPRANELP